MKRVGHFPFKFIPLYVVCSFV